MRNVVRAILARRACKRSERIIAVSNHVRHALESRWRIDAERIAVVPHGVDILRTDTPVAALTAVPFVFTAGSIRPARGLEDLLRARAAVPSDHRIAIAGDVEHDAYAASLRAIHSGDDRVVWLGRLSPEAMAWCFRNARAFVMTSRAEACPNTVLEALAYGCLSVSTNQPPMPEFYGDAALYYRGGDVRDLERALALAFALDANDRRAMRDRALARSRLFTWESTVDATLAELQRAISYDPGRLYHARV
jgi:glycosyltransferase involved in cell wall biosynthesis